MADRVHLGIDIGAESGRVMAGIRGPDGWRLEEVHRFPNGPVDFGGSLRWNLPGLWDGIQQGLRRAAARHGDAVVSVGVDTWALDYVLRSASGELLGLPFCYRDSRTRGWVEELCRRVPRREIFQATGLQFLEINTLPQWMAHHAASPEVFAAAARFLMIPDWIHAMLCGTEAVEFTNATTTQFLDPRTRSWAGSLLGRLGLPTHPLPPIVAPGTSIGRLREPVLRATGLGPVEVVTPATHDTASAVAAVPTVLGGTTRWAYISSGTWSLVGIESPVPILDDRALAWNVTNEGGVDGTWRVLKNVMGLWLVQRCRAAWGREEGSSGPEYTALATAAAAATPWRSLIDPDDPRFLNPPDMPAEIRAACRDRGEPEPRSPAEVIRCVLESLALKYARVLEELEALGGSAIEVVHVVGGGARNALLNQFTADASGRRVEAGPTEATALGNVLVQSRTTDGPDSLAAIRSVVRAMASPECFEPDISRAEGWAAARERFRTRIETAAATDRV